MFSQFSPANSQADAATIDELRQQSQRLQAEIQANNEKVHALSEQAETLQGKVDQLQAEIAVANGEIKLTEVKLDELTAKLKEAEIELERQKGLLKSTLQAIYERSGASTFELLMATDSFTAFVNEQEYLGQLQSAVKQSTDKVISLKQQIEAQKVEQEELLKKQQQQRAIVDAKRAEQQDILDKTQGEEAKYRAIVQAQHEALDEAEKQLAALLSAGGGANLGPISRGQKVGEVGSTGASTGPHIHFMVRHNGATVNPLSSGTTLINGYLWPTPSSYRITTNYGSIHCSDYVGCSPRGSSYYVWHSGLDIGASAGSDIVAADSGIVTFKGCSAGLGYVVVINHGNGWETWYPHMITPSGQIWGWC